jgi:hypothetical protein
MTRCNPWRRRISVETFFATLYGVLALVGINEMKTGVPILALLAFAATASAQQLKDPSVVLKVKKCQVVVHVEWNPLADLMRP